MAYFLHNETVVRDRFYTFVLVALRLDTEDCHDHDDDHDGGGGQRDQEPRLAVEGLRLQVAVLEESLRGGLNL